MNNPINNVDPDGRFVITVPTLIIGGALAIATAYYGTKAMNETRVALENRRKNRIPDIGEPGTVGVNPPGTTKKKYGPDGWVEKEWNQGHGPDAPPAEQDDHIHDHIPNPYHPDGRPDRQPGRELGPGEEDDFCE